MKVKSERYVPALRALACAAALAMAGGVPAAEEEPAGAEPEEVSTGDAEQQSRRVEGEGVRTRHEHGQVITEYRRRGGVYMMTVKPRIGPTQYWNDPDGDGQFQNSTSDDIDENLNLPKWRLGGW